jgi:hypothetical protein
MIRDKDNVSGLSIHTSVDELVAIQAVAEDCTAQSLADTLFDAGMLAIRLGVKAASSAFDLHAQGIVDLCHNRFTPAVYQERKYLSLLSEGLFDQAAERFAEARAVKPRRTGGI